MTRLRRSQTFLVFLWKREVDPKLPSATRETSAALEPKQRSDPAARALDISRRCAAPEGCRPADER